MSEGQRTTRNHGYKKGAHHRKITRLPNISFLLSLVFVGGGRYFDTWSHPYSRAEHDGRIDNLTMEEMAAGLIMSMEARGEKPGWVC